MSVNRVIVRFVVRGGYAIALTGPYGYLLRPVYAPDRPPSVYEWRVMLAERLNVPLRTVKYVRQ